MTKVITFIKQLFCRHEWMHPGDEELYEAGKARLREMCSLNIFEVCSKCGKVREFSYSDIFIEQLNLEREKERAQFLEDSRRWYNLEAENKRLREEADAFRTERILLRDEKKRLVEENRNITHISMLLRTERDNLRAELKKHERDTYGKTAKEVEQEFYKRVNERLYEDLKKNAGGYSPFGFGSGFNAAYYREANPYYNANRYSGFKAEPAPKPPLAECFKTLGFNERPESVDEIKKKYRVLAKAKHPDYGGTNSGFDKIVKAYKEALETMGGK